MEKHLRYFVRSYLATAEWLLPEPMEGEHTVKGFSIEAIKCAISDCKEFIRRVREAFPQDQSEYILNRNGKDLTYLAPHEFYLTRNHHGAGFWDGNWKEYEGLGDKLTKLSDDMKESNTYVGDNGYIYFD